jgi:crotonobetainyl-CoA:carnitine CoA-transferase CaiB-like acyl-CoA transferase
VNAWLTIEDQDRSAMPLADLRVLDASNLIAGPFSSTYLGDFGANVIKIEHPESGDSLRNHGKQKDGEPLWWKYLGRNKRSITLDLGADEARQIFVDLATEADVVVENFRPGTMAKWGLDYATLSAANPKLVMAHVTGFGQHGPLSHRPGFGTMGETMTGFAYRNGYPDGPPTLPPFGLADTVTGLMTAFAILVAVHESRNSGSGQEIDLALIESLLPSLEPQIGEWDQLGQVLGRMGNANPMNAPRNLYQTKDKEWVAISASTLTTAERLLTLVGHAEVIKESWFRSAGERAEHADYLNELIAPWMAARTKAEVLAACDAVQAPCSPIYSVRDVVEDPQYAALGTIATVADKVLGPIRMLNVPFRLSKTPGKVSWPGPALGEDNEAVYGALGLDLDRQRELRERGVI